MSILNLLQQGVKNATKVYNTVDETVFKGTLPLGSAAQLTDHTAILHGIPHTFNGKKWVPSKEYNATNRDTAVELMQKRREESTADQPEGYGSGLSMPGVSEFHEELTSDFKHVPAMSLKVMNPSSTPKAAVELRAKYNSPENRTIFGQSKAVSTPYNSEEYGAGTLYISRHSNGEVKFNPTELNEPSYARARRQLQLMEGVQTALSLAGGLRIRGGRRTPTVQTTSRRDPLNKFHIDEKAFMAPNVTPRTSVSTTSKPTVTPNTTAGSLKHQSSRYDPGVNYVYRAAVIRGINPKSQVKAMGDYGSGDISTGESVQKPSIRDLVWLNKEQIRLVNNRLNRKTPDIDGAYDILSTLGSWGPRVYQVASAREQGKKQHHKFAKYASAAFVLRQMELVKQGKADISDILQLHNLSYHYSLPMGGGRWGIQNVLADPHDAGHTLARNVGWEHKGKPFQQISKELLTLDTPEEVAYAMVDFIKTKGKPSLEAMLSLEETYREAYGSLNPEQMRAFIFRKALKEADMLNQLNLN